MKQPLGPILLGSFVVVLSGCVHKNTGYDNHNPGCANVAGGITWHHKVKTTKDFTRDEMTCSSSASLKAENARMPGNVFMIADETRACLQQELGWIPGCE